MNSILTTIKVMLGPEADYEAFDPELIVFINSAINTLTQLGVGPVQGFRISDDTSTWQEFIGSDPRLESVKQYLFLKVKMAFDPPQSSIVMETYKEMVRELESRFTYEVETFIPANP